MDLLSSGNALDAIRGKARVCILDFRSPLTSPITLLVMTLKACGFEWYGAQKRQADGSTATTAFLDTTACAADGTKVRRVVWNLQGDTLVELGGDPIGLHVLAAALGYVAPHRPSRPIPAPRPGAAAVIAQLRAALPLTEEIPFNERGRRMLAAAHACSHPEARALVGTIIDLYRGYCWKLSTPPGTPPHPDYGYPLDRHYRYHRGKRRGDVRQSICHDERMEELRSLGLR